MVLFINSTQISTSSSLQNHAVFLQTNVNIPLFGCWCKDLNRKKCLLLFMCIRVAMTTTLWQISCYFVKMISEVSLLCWESISCNQLENKIKQSDWCQKHVELSQAESYLAEKTRYISFEPVSHFLLWYLLVSKHYYYSFLFCCMNHLGNRHIYFVTTQRGPDPQVGNHCSEPTLNTYNSDNAVCFSGSTLFFVIFFKSQYCCR